MIIPAVKGLQCYLQQTVYLIQAKENNNRFSCFNMKGGIEILVPYVLQDCFLDIINLIHEFMPCENIVLFMYIKIYTT